MNYHNNLASSQAIVFSPIMQENDNVKYNYYLYLKRLISILKYGKRKYVKEQMSLYKNFLCGEKKVKKHIDIHSIDSYCFLIPFDVAAVTAYDEKLRDGYRLSIIADTIKTDFALQLSDTALIRNELRVIFGMPENYETVIEDGRLKCFESYIRLALSNIAFQKSSPFRILITANMSAGKSTLINSIIGKNISLVQNMACTSKIHTIVSKPFEDGITSEYDYDLSLIATKDELLNDNENNRSLNITVGTYFNGMLGGRRVVLLDSPGVNSSENADHVSISRKMIVSKKYNAIVYVLNATNLASTDEETHLKFVAENLGRKKIFFVINKVDQLIGEDEDITGIINGQKRFLESVGFNNPVICPVSAKAAFLAKKSRLGEMSRIGQSELNVLCNKFSDGHIADYYEKVLKCSAIPLSGDEAEDLIRNSGLSYFENTIIKCIDGSKSNRSGICGSTRM